MGTYGYISIIAMVCYGFMLLMFLTAKRNKIVNSFLVVLVGLLFWAGGSAFMRVHLWPSYEFWYQAYTECPGAHKDIYLYGVRIMDWKINTEKDPAKKAALIDDLMKVYDTRVKYFGNDRKYGKDWIIARKAADYIRLKGDNADPKVYYAWLGEVINEFGENSEAMGVSLYMMGSHRQLLADPNFKETYLEDYLKCSKIIATQLAAAQAANNEKVPGTINLPRWYAAGL